MKKLVIVGGGFAGAKIARNLQKKFETVLIDNKDYFEFTPSILRAIVFPKHLKRIHVHHRDYLEKTKIVRGKAVRIKNKKIILKDGKKIGFDYLVIASGSKYNNPIKAEGMLIADRGAGLTTHNNKIGRSKSILIIGGGPVGVELAGEITDKYRGKNVTIIHSGDSLMNRNSVKARNFARSFLEKRGVKMIFNERVEKKTKGFVETDKKNKFECDTAILCTGIKPNSNFIDKSLLDWKGFIDVNNHLQMRGSQNIFVCGDVASVNEEKTAQAAEKQAEIVIKNLELMGNKNENEKNLERYHPKKRISVTSLGRWNGILENGNFVMTGIIPAFLKGVIERRTMFRYGQI